SSNNNTNSLPLHLLRHGSALIATGLIWGFLVPLTPHPRLALTAHIQFAVEGVMVVAAGLVLNSEPFSSPDIFSDTKNTAVTVPHRRRLADRLSIWQTRVVRYGCAGIWVTLLSEIANAWWGTRWVLPIAHAAAGLAGEGQTAAVWMERVVQIAHLPFAVVLAAV
ncbi:hypothetical protein B0T17DRAFT_476694, partial [Bombardia bombarda]